MNFINEKEKKLNTALAKLKNLDLSNPDLQNNIENLSIQKNQLEIEKSELEQKYKILTEEHESLTKKLEEIQSKEFNNSRFKDLGNNSLLNVEIKTINDDATFDINSIKMLYTLPVNSFTLVDDKDNNIFLVKIIDSKKNFFNKSDEDYLQFVNNENTNNRKSILQSYDQLLNNKYQVNVNQKSVDRVKNYFK